MKKQVNEITESLEESTIDKKRAERERDKANSDLKDTKIELNV